MSITSAQWTSQLYRNLEVLQTGRRDQIILPASCYPHLDTVSAVSIAHFEAWHLASSWPVLWRATDAGEVELCALVTEPVFSPSQTRHMRPRLVVAYPFAAAWLDGADGTTFTVMYDRAPGVPSPTAGGQPVIDGLGNFTPVAQEKIEALFLYAAGLETTRRFTQELVLQGLLQPWTVAVRSGGQSRPLVGAYRLADDWLARLDRSRFSEEQLPRLMELLQAHLISARHPHLGHESHGA